MCLLWSKVNFPLGKIWGSVWKKLSPKESVKCAHTVLRGGVRAHKGLAWANATFHTTVTGYMNVLETIHKVKISKIYVSNVMQEFMHGQFVWHIQRTPGSVEALASWSEVLGPIGSLIRARVMGWLQPSHTAMETMWPNWPTQKTLHHITLHHNTLDHITLHHNTLDHITLHHNTLHHNTMLFYTIHITSEVTNVNYSCPP